MCIRDRVAALVGAGIGRPWSHQVEAAEAVRRGEDVVLATGTASGKSLGYLLPLLTAVLDGTSAPSGRGATALYLAPTKALAEDQRARVDALTLPGPVSYTHLDVYKRQGFIPSVTAVPYSYAPIS